MVINRENSLFDILILQNVTFLPILDFAKLISDETPLKHLKCLNFEINGYFWQYYKKGEFLQK